VPEFGATPEQWERNEASKGCPSGSLARVTDYHNQLHQSHLQVQPTPEAAARDRRSAWIASWHAICDPILQS